MHGGYIGSTREEAIVMSRSSQRERERADFARRPFKEQLMDLLALHAGERRGTVFLMMIIGIMVCWYIYAQWFRKPDITDLEPLRTEMEAWLAERDTSLAAQALSEPFPFDPNTIGREQWKALGL